MQQVHTYMHICIYIPLYAEVYFPLYIINFIIMLKKKFRIEQNSSTGRHQLDQLVQLPGHFGADQMLKHIIKCIAQMFLKH